MISDKEYLYGRFWFCEFGGDSVGGDFDVNGVFEVFEPEFSVFGLSLDLMVCELGESGILDIEGVFVRVITSLGEWMAGN